jgi:hypothetical protein
MEKLETLETLKKIKKEAEILEPLKVTIDTSKKQTSNYVVSLIKYFFSCSSKSSVYENIKNNVTELEKAKETTIEILINKTENLEQNLENIKGNVENIKENVEKIKEKSEQEQEENDDRKEAESKEINDKLLEIQKAHEKIEELETNSLETK